MILSLQFFIIVTTRYVIFSIKVQYMQQSEEENIRLGKNILYNRNKYMQSLNLCVVDSPHVEMLLVYVGRNAHLY